jgi:hypothetical protein
VPPPQPVSQLLRVPAHLGTELLQGQSIDLFVPCQFFHDIVRTGDRVVLEEGDDLGKATKVDVPIVLPVPDSGGGNAEPGRDILLA